MNEQQLEQELAALDSKEAPDEQSLGELRRDFIYNELYLLVMCNSAVLDNPDTAMTWKGWGTRALELFQRRLPIFYNNPYYRTTLFKNNWDWVTLKYLTSQQTKTYIRERFVEEDMYVEMTSRNLIYMATQDGAGRHPEVQRKIADISVDMLRDIQEARALLGIR